MTSRIERRAAPPWLAAILCLAWSLAGAADLEDVVARVKPSVVAIGTFQPTRNPQFTFRGTGFAVGDGALVVTNAHVLPPLVDTQHLEALAIMLPATEAKASERREASVVALDPDHDVALLRISGAALKPLKFAPPNSIREGQSIAFTGFPIGSALGMIPVTHRGIVSAITPIALPTDAAIQLDERRIRRLKSGPFRVLQLDGTAYPGNSGGPLYDAGTGDVIGIINMVMVKATKESVLSQPSGITFAVPAQYAADLVAGNR